jgi:hypothetical protein
MAWLSLVEMAGLMVFMEHLVPGVDIRVGAYCAGSCLKRRNRIANLGVGEKIFFLSAYAVCPQEPVSKLFLAKSTHNRQIASMRR